MTKDQVEESVARAVAKVAVGSRGATVRSWFDDQAIQEIARAAIEAHTAALAAAGLVVVPREPTDECETQKQAATDWMNVIGYLPRSYEPELHGIVEDAFSAGYRAAMLATALPTDRTERET